MIGGIGYGNSDYGKEGIGGINKNYIIDKNKNKNVYRYCLNDPANRINRIYKTRVFWNTQYKMQFNSSKGINDNTSNYGNVSNKRFSNGQVHMNSNKMYYSKSVDYINRKTKYKLCGDKRCLTCKKADMEQISKDSDRKFCKTYNCIYILTCELCDMRYIGETSNNLNIRINQHRSDTKHYKKNDKYAERVEIGHFNIHGFQNVKIGILKIVINHKKRLWYESSMMNNMKTIYPYGLNMKYFNKSMSYVIKNENSGFIYNNYNMHYETIRYTRSKCRRRKRCKDREILRRNIDKKLTEINAKFEENFKINWIKKYVFALNKFELEIIKEILERDKNKNTQAYDICRDLVKYLHVKHNIKSKMEKPEDMEYLVILFMNKSYDNINFNNIILKNIDYFPIKSISVKKAFRYNTPLGRLTFNYNIKNWENENINTCNCGDYAEFIDKNHGHIITGNMDFLKLLNIGEELREIMKMGTKYRLNMTNNKKDILKQLLKDFKTFVMKIAIKYNRPLESFDEWLYYIERDLKAIKFEIHKGIKNKDIKADIDKVQRNYIITYVDKSDSNFAIICKTYYLQMLKDTISNSEAYERCNIGEREIINRIKAKHLQLGLGLGKVKFPYIFLIPKFHKNPIKFRSVTSAYKTYNVKPNKNLHTIIQNKLTDIKDKIIIYNSLELVEKMKNRIISGVYTWDFQDLFNSIKIEDLIKSLEIFYLENNLNNSIEHNKYKKLYNLILKENYIAYNNEFYVQKEGIPQGSISSNSLANMYLYTYEKNCINQNNIIMFRYIDDLVAFSIDHNNINIKTDFYPEYLNLINTNNNPLSANFLDLKIDIVDNSMVTNIYDKRKEFDFKVIKIINWTSNMSKLIYRNVILNYINRNRKLITFKQEKIEDIKNFFNTAINNNYPMDFLHVYLIQNYIKKLQ